jgi:hypothetical protein
MSQALTILALLLAFCLPLLLVLWWPTRDWRFGVLLVGLVLSGWFLLISGGMIAKYSHDADIYERASLGMPVTQVEYLQDGTGDNALALFFGWLVPALGAGIGWLATAARSRASRRRGFPVVATASDSGPAAA